MESASSWSWVTNTESHTHFLLDLLQLCLHLLTQSGIRETPNEFIQKQYLRFIHQGSGNGNTLLLTAGQ